MAVLFDSAAAAQKHFREAECEPKMFVEDNRDLPVEERDNCSNCGCLCMVKTTLYCNEHRVVYCINECMDCGIVRRFGGQ